MYSTELSKIFKNAFKIIRESEDQLIVEVSVRAKPSSRVEKIKISEQGILEIQFRAKPVDGEANLALKEILSSLFGVSKSEVELLKGSESKLKKFGIIMALGKKKSFNEYIEKLRKIV